MLPRNGPINEPHPPFHARLLAALGITARGGSWTPPDDRVRRGESGLAEALADAREKLLRAQESERVAFVSEGEDPRGRSQLIEQVRRVIDAVVLPEGASFGRKIASVGALRAGENIARLHDLPYTELVYHSLDISTGSPHATVGFRFLTDGGVVIVRRFHQPVRDTFVSLHRLDDVTPGFVADLLDDFLQRAVSGRPDRSPSGSLADAPADEA